MYKCINLLWELKLKMVITLKKTNYINNKLKKRFQWETL